MTPSATPGRTMLAVATAVAALHACTATAPDGSAAPDGPGGGFDRFYAQELVFEPCDAYATTAGEFELLGSSDTFDCSRMAVPLDYGDPGGATIQISILRVPARGADPVDHGGDEFVCRRDRVVVLGRPATSAGERVMHPVIVVGLMRQMHSAATVLVTNQLGWVS